MTLPLTKALLALQTESEVKRFLTDLLTPQEWRAFEERWQIAQLLDSGAYSYRDIAEKTGASTTTVARVARFLKEEPHQGYRLVLDQLSGLHRRKA